MTLSSHELENEDQRLCDLFNASHLVHNASVFYIEDWPFSSIGPLCSEGHGEPTQANCRRGSCRDGCGAMIGRYHFWVPFSEWESWGEAGKDQVRNGDLVRSFEASRTGTRTVSDAIQEQRKGAWCDSLEQSWSVPIPTACTHTHTQTDTRRLTEVAFTDCHLCGVRVEPVYLGQE